MILPKAKETVNGWYDKGHVVILTTARPMYLRHHTMKELSEAGIRYHQLVTDCGRAERYLINDKHFGDPDRAIGINLNTDQGFENIVDIDKLTISNPSYQSTQCLKHPLDTVTHAKPLHNLR